MPRSKGGQMKKDMERFRGPPKEPRPQVKTAPFKPAPKQAQKTFKSPRGK